MRRTGIADLPLHHGRAPKWLTSRMKRLAKAIATIIINECGVNEFLLRISDPFWFQAFGCVLGYDWHSSGVTTVVTGILKAALEPEQHGIGVCGGKGKTSKRTPFEIENVAERLNISSGNIDNMRYASKMSAKIDNTALQAGYQLYHHAFFMTEDAKWAVIQQGMCIQDRTARRYHWFSDTVQDFTVEPHTAIVCNVKRRRALNMTAKGSEGCKKASLDLVKESTNKIMKIFPRKTLLNQKSLQDWLPNSLGTHTKWAQSRSEIAFLSMPRRMNWKALKEVYEFQPANYEELLSFEGIGPATIRGLALVAEIVYGERPSWEDPVKFSFAYGGKDGVPFPVNCQAMDRSLEILKEAIDEAKIGREEKIWSMKRLKKFFPVR